MKPLKVMLIDDEILVLNHLQKLIPWEEHGFQIVAAVTNSHKALELLEKTRPDIIIVDICMPVMNGLEFCRRLQSVSHPVKILLLTSYRDFEYAKQAVELGVSNYLLKHELHDGRLLEELTKLAKELEQLKNKEGIIRRQLIRDLLEGGEPSAAMLNDPVFSHGGKGDHFLLLLLQTDAVFPVIADHTEPRFNSGENDLWDEIQLPEKICLIDALPLGAGTWEILLLAKGYFSRQQLWEDLYSTACALRRIYNERHPETLSIVISDPVEDLRGLRREYQRAKKAINYVFFAGRERIIASHEIDIEESSAGEDLRPDLETVAKSLGDEDAAKTGLSIEALFDKVISPGYDLEGFKIICRELINMLDGFRNNNHLESMRELMREGRIDTGKWYTAREIRQWFLEEFQNALAAARNSNLNRYSKRVRQIIDYLHQYYPEDITVSDLAGKFNMSGDHLRHIFKEETGRTILDYLTRIRMAKAKKLLEGGDYKIYEIAQKVGYKTSQYFSRVFRKTLGINPVDYAEGRAAKDENEH